MRTKDRDAATISTRDCRVFLSLVIAFLLLATKALAESPAPTVHWGGLAYPDQYTTLTFGGTLNRFTEFDGRGERYDSTVHETLGLNFISGSWSKHWDQFEGWSTNITFGVGPTANEPTNTIQNDVFHKAFGYSRVPAGVAREETDGMVDGSVTKWINALSQQKVGFVGTGFSTGTLYHEGYARAGLRRLSMGILSDYLRFSGMGRYSRVFNGAVIHDVKPSTLVWQASISVGSYKTEALPPPFEFELGVTWDSGIFVNFVGESRKEKFVTGSITIYAVKFEMWNDLINQKDKGPTGGGTLTLDLCRVFPGSLGVFCARPDRA